MSKSFQFLTMDQQRLVSENLNLVPRAINIHILRDFSNPDMSWDDLYQTGCLALCKAAIGYDNQRDFEPYASRTIRNALYDYCSKAYRYHQRLCADNPADIPTPGDPFLSLYDTDLTAFLKDRERHYTGVTKKGITYLIKKAEGYTSADLSKEFGVPSNSIRAWMSLAAKKLRQEPELYEHLA